MTKEKAKDLLDNLIGFVEDNHGSDYDEALKLAIKALEQEPCEDAISRQAVENITWEEPSYTDALNVLTEVREKIRQLPPVTPQQRWIPVSERMPEEHKDVLTCSLGGFIEIQSFENAHDGYWKNQNGAWSDLDEVAAWMPLPEPYKAESEE